MPTTWTAEVTSFRQAILADYLVGMLGAAESVRPDIPKIIVAIDDRFDGADGYGTNDWNLLSHLPYLDEFATDPYVSGTNFFANMAKLRAVDRPGLTLGMWASAFHLGTNVDDYDRIREAIRIEWGSGIEHVSVWISETGFPNTYPDLAVQRIREGFADPLGVFESALTRREGIEIDGWGLDPSSTDPIHVQVYVDGRFWSRIRADRHRAGLDRFFPTHGSGHGFHVLVPTDVRAHQVCLYLDDVGPGEGPVALGCKVA